MILLLMSLSTAVAGRPPALTVTAADSRGEPVASAAVHVDIEDDRHEVNAVTGAWTGSVLYLKDGTEVPLERGSKVSGWVVAPGYRPARFEVEVKKRKERLDITLSSMDLRATLVPLPQAEEAQDVRRVLRMAAAALSQEDLTTASERLEAADRGRVSLEGPSYVDATMAVMEFRTLIALSAWRARVAMAETDPSEANMAALDVSRGLTADLALDWRDYARKAGRDDARAVALCRTASGRSSRCD